MMNLPPAAEVEILCARSCQRNGDFPELVPRWLVAAGTLATKRQDARVTDGERQSAGGEGSRRFSVTT
jgi:hypothetical protein